MISNYQKCELERLIRKIPPEKAGKILIVDNDDNFTFTLMVDQDDIPVLEEYLKQASEAMSG